MFNPTADDVELLIARAEEKFTTNKAPDHVVKCTLDFLHECKSLIEEGATLAEQIDHERGYSQRGQILRDELNDVNRELDNVTPSLKIIFEWASEV